MSWRQACNLFRHLMGLFSFLGGLRLLERFRLKWKTSVFKYVTWSHFPKCDDAAELKRAAGSDHSHLHGALASSVSSRTVFASGATAVPFSAAAPLPFTALAPLFTLLSVSAPASSLPGARTSAPAPTSSFPEIVHHKSNISEMTAVCPFTWISSGNGQDAGEKKNPGALTSYFGHRAH